jgi:Transmembrane secretion effector
VTGAEFLQAMPDLRRSRPRTGATGWAFTGTARTRSCSPSWEEHLRQHRERQTATDLQYHAAACPTRRRKTDHYLAAAVPT